MKRVILLFSVLLSVIAFAGENPEHGYIITNQNDTIFGMIDYRSNANNVKICNFKSEGSDKYSMYKPFEIVGYYVTSKNNYYISKSLEYKGKNYNVFAEYMMKGAMNVYRVAGITKNDVYFFENENGEIMPYCNYTDMETAEESDIHKNAQNLAAFLAKSSLKASDEVDVRNSSAKQVIKIARTYNEDVCKSNDSCIEYEYNAKNDDDSGAFFAYIGSLRFRSINGLAIKSNNVPVIGVGYEVNTSRYVKNTSVQMMAELGGYSYYDDEDVWDKGNKSSSLVVLKLAPTFKFYEKNGIRLTIRSGVSTPLLCGFAGIGAEIVTSSGIIMFNIDATSDVIEASRIASGTWEHYGIKLGYKF